MPNVTSGAVREPTNRTYQERGSIHDDATAQKLGFRGGTIAGSTHMDQFPPILLEVFGPAWFETGSLSLYFRHATVDGEAVQAFVEHPDDAVRQPRAWMTMADGTLVAEGTASVIAGADEPTALYARDLRHDPAGLRILARLSGAMAIERATARVTSEEQTQRVSEGLITEPLPWYTGDSPWGGAVAAPSTVVELFTRAAGARLLPVIGRAVGLWGAIEVRHHAGPVFVDVDYEVSGTVVALGNSPKTEILWYDMSALRDGVLVATMRILTRFVKASSPLYPS